MDLVYFVTSSAFPALSIIWKDPSYHFSFAFLQATTSGKYVDLCLEMLVGNFTPPSSFINILNHPRGITKKEQVLSRVHSTLGRITNLVPLATLRLSTLVIQKKPSHFSKEFVSLVVLYTFLFYNGKMLLHFDFNLFRKN